MPLIGSAGASVDADDTEVAVERMTEEELLKGLEGLAPPEEQPEEDDKSERRGRPKLRDLPKARTFVRAFAFVDIFAVTMRPCRRGAKLATAVPVRPGGRMAAWPCEIERLRPEGC